jgi:ribokinase
MTEREHSAVVLGSVHMDLVARAKRLPGRGESVVGDHFSMSPGGKGGNQACQLALLGLNTFMLTRLGNDDFGRLLIAALKSKGVDTSFIAVDPSEPTGASTVFAAENDYSSIIANGAAGRLSTQDIKSAQAKIENADALVLQLELPVELSLYAAKIARSAGKRVVLNASPAPAYIGDIPKGFLEVTDVLVVNAVEAEVFLGRKMQINALANDATELAKKLKIEIVVITAGASGSAVFSAGQALYQPAFAASVIDTIGAGDAYLGTLVAGLVENLALKEILKRAAAAGAVAVSRQGAFEALPSRDDIDRLITI